MTQYIDEAVAITLPLIRRFEGFRAKPYLCPAGVPTIGYGSTRYEDGTQVTLQDAPISRDRAEAILIWQLRRSFLPQVLRLCPGIDSPRRLAATLDFTYNLGAGNLKASTLRRRINAQDWDAAQVELGKWVRAGGKVLPGLVARRNAEILLMD